MTLSTKSVWAGGQVVLSASALSPNQREPIEIGNQVVATAITDGNGNFQLGVSVPWSETPGRSSIAVMDTAGSSRRSCSSWVIGRNHVTTKRAPDNELVRDGALHDQCGQGEREMERRQ